MRCQRTRIERRQPSFTYVFRTQDLLVVSSIAKILDEQRSLQHLRLEARRIDPNESYRRDLLRPTLRSSDTGPGFRPLAARHPFADTHKLRWLGSVDQRLNEHASILLDVNVWHLRVWRVGNDPLNNTIGCLKVVSKLLRWKSWTKSLYFFAFKQIKTILRIRHEGPHVSSAHLASQTL